MHSTVSLGVIRTCHSLNLGRELRASPEFQQRELVFLLSVLLTHGE